ncbi:MAG TPA: putative quinol monooxygenase [Longimicrobiales bacterium]
MADTKVRVVIIYTAQPARVTDGLAALQDIVTTVLEHETDCLDITIHQDVDDATKFLLFETWTSKAAFTGEHMKTPHIQAFMQKAASLFTGPPAITFWRDV